MYHVVVVKDEGIELESFNSLEKAIGNADANTEDSEVARIGIFKHYIEIAEWFCCESRWWGYEKAAWSIFDGNDWKPGHPALFLNNYRIIQEQGIPGVHDCAVDCVGRV